MWDKQSAAYLEQSETKQNRHEQALLMLIIGVNVPTWIMLSYTEAKGTRPGKGCDVFSWLSVSH